MRVDRSWMHGAVRGSLIDCSKESTSVFLNNANRSTASTAQVSEVTGAITRTRARRSRLGVRPRRPERTCSRAAPETSPAPRRQRGAESANASVRSRSASFAQSSRGEAFRSRALSRSETSSTRSAMRRRRRRGAQLAQQQCPRPLLPYPRPRRAPLNIAALAARRQLGRRCRPAPAAASWPTAARPARRRRGEVTTRTTARS